MLSLFPQILFLAPLSITLLRVSAGLLFAYLAYYHLSNRQTVSQELSRYVGGAGGFLALLYAVVEIAVGGALVAGALTQLAGLVGFVVALKVLILWKMTHGMNPISRLSYALLAVISLSLVFSGAGALALDWPL
jgi:uncharacterized membrane protein YphA (DoxX/SURF4 family)